MTTRFKICGLRTVEAVTAAVDAGAAAIGFNCYPASARYLAPELAAAVAQRVPLWVERVALFVNADLAQIREGATRVGAGSVQLYGAVTPELCAALSEWRVILARPAVAGETVEQLRPFAGHLAAVLLDAAVPGQHGGTGQPADWAEARRVREAYPKWPLILAGGLRADSVAAAIAAVRPYAVDVASGIERAPGEADLQRIREFAAAVKRTDR